MSILGNTIDAPNDQEKFLLNYDYDFMKESYSDGLDKEQLVPEPGNAEMEVYLNMVADIQNARIGAAQPGEQDDFIFYTNIEQAQARRAAGRLEEAISILNGIPQPARDEEQDLLAKILCFTQTELSLRNGILIWDEVEDAMAYCGLQPELRLVEATSTGAASAAKDDIRIRPNPTKDRIWITGLGDGECTVRIRDAMGRVVLQVEHIQENGSVPMDRLASGMYTCQLIPAAGSTHVERLVVE